MSDTYTAEMAHAAAARGAAWLDEKCPDWVERVDIARLDLSSRSMCALGQTANCLVATKRPAALDSYGHVLNHFGLTTPWLTAQGFDAPIHKWRPSCEMSECRAEVVARYEMLTIAWKELLRERLAVPA